MNNNLLDASLSGPAVDMPINVRALVLDKDGNIKQEIVKHNKATRNMTEGIIRFLRGEFTETFVRDFKPSINNIGYDKDKAREFIPTHIGIGNIGVSRIAGSNCGKIDPTFVEQNSNSLDNFYNTIYSPSYSDTCLRSEILPYYNRHRSLIQKSVKGDSSLSDAYELVVQGYYQFNQSLSVQDTLVDNTVFDKNYLTEDAVKTLTINELIDDFNDDTKFNWLALNNNTSNYSFRISTEYSSEPQGFSGELRVNINDFSNDDVGFKTNKYNMSLTAKGDGIRVWIQLNAKDNYDKFVNSDSKQVTLSLKINGVYYSYTIPTSEIPLNDSGKHFYIKFNSFVDNSGNSLAIADNTLSSDTKIAEICFKLNSTKDDNYRYTLYIDDLSFYDTESQFNFIYADTVNSSNPSFVEKFLEVDDETGESVECITVTELGLFSGDIESKGLNTRLLARVLLDAKNPLILSENDTMIVNWQIGVYSLNDNLDAGNIDYKYVTKPISEYTDGSPFRTIEISDIENE